MPGPNVGGDPQHLLLESGGAQEKQTCMMARNSESCRAPSGAVCYVEDSNVMYRTLGSNSSCAACWRSKTVKGESSRTLELDDWLNRRGGLLLVDSHLFGRVFIIIAGFRNALEPLISGE